MPVDVGDMVTVRHRTSGEPLANGVVVGFDHEHQFVCVEVFKPNLLVQRFMDLNADRLTMGWQFKGSN